MRNEEEVANREAIPLAEKILFEHRTALIVVFSIVTALLFYQALKLRPDASFEKMIPTKHPYIANFLKHKEDLKGLSNTVRIAVETTGDSIFDYDYLETLKKINDDVFLIPGVDRSALKSLWTPLTRWTEVTEEGFDGGPVIPEDYDGSARSIQQLKINVLKSGEVGRIVANDFKSSIIVVPLLSIDSITKQPLDYQVFSARLENAIRDTYQTEDIKIHITGFAKLMGDLLDGATLVSIFFVIAFIVLLAFLYYSSRCLRSTGVRAVSSLVAVIWQLGLLQLFGFGLNPYSMLVPFLMFALGVSHGIQMNNAMALELMAGAKKYWAARRAYRKVYVPGLAALFTDCVGFATLYVIQIGVIQDIAVGASIGVAIVAITDLSLLPILLSYTGIGQKSIDKLQQGKENKDHPIWKLIASFTDKKAAGIVIACSIVVLALGLYERKNLQIGDLDKGAPELHSDSRYNLDNEFIVNNYSTSSDIFVVMVETNHESCGEYSTLVAMDQLHWELEGMKEVQSVLSLSSVVKKVIAGFNEGNLKWMTLSRNGEVLEGAVSRAPFSVRNPSCDLALLVVFLNDHKAETLRNVVDVVNRFADGNRSESVDYLLAGGNAGIEAATNIAIQKAQTLMTALVYGVVFCVCLITYRSFKAALCIVLPLALTSILCEAMMAYLDIGVKVATLPVIAVGVGIGVDYGIYIYNKLSQNISRGMLLADAYYDTLKTSGMAVMFTGTTLAIGVGTWAFSPIKFQADMGVLLTFMFIVNMLGAVLIMPALASFLLAKDQS